MGGQCADELHGPTRSPSEGIAGPHAEGIGGLDEGVRHAEIDRRIHVNLCASWDERAHHAAAHTRVDAGLCAYRYMFIFISLRPVTAGRRADLQDTIIYYMLYIIYYILCNILYYIYICIY